MVNASSVAASGVRIGRTPIAIGTMIPVGPNNLRRPMSLKAGLEIEST